MAALVERPLNHYPAALFVGVPPEFTCESICFNVLKDAVSCTAGHTMCRGCADKLRPKECPVCKAKLDLLVPVRAVNEGVARAEVRCFTRLDADGNLVDDENDVAGAAAASSSGSSSGTAAGGKRKAAGGGGGGGKGKAKKAKIDVCDWVGPLKDAEEHFKVCPYAGVRCPYQGCGLLVARRDLAEHQGTCEHGKRACKWAGCGATFALDALAAHENICVKRVVGCPNNGCNANRIAFDVLVAHRRTCRYETVACPYAGVGCTDRMQRKDVDAHKRDAMAAHNELLLAGYCNLQHEVNTLKEEGGRRYKEVIAIKVKHAELTGAEPFVPRDPTCPTKILSEKLVVDERLFRLVVDTNYEGAPDHYAVFLRLEDGPLPCKVKYTHELMHHDGQAASAEKKSTEDTFDDEHKSWGWQEFVPKARLADAATSPYVKNGYVTFKCTFEVVE